MNAQSSPPSTPPETDRNRRRGLRVVIAVGLLVAAAAIVLTWRRASLPVVIQMEDSPTGGIFEPATVTVAAGTTVQWKNVGEQAHDATSNPARAMRAGDASNPAGAPPFDSGLLSPGQSFSYTFAIPGTYKYVCLPHEFGGMTGEVIVTK